MSVKLELAHVLETAKQKLVSRPEKQAQGKSRSSLRCPLLCGTYSQRVIHENRTAKMVPDFRAVKITLLPEWVPCRRCPPTLGGLTPPSDRRRGSRGPRGALLRPTAAPSSPAVTRKHKLHRYPFTAAAPKEVDSTLCSASFVRALPARPSGWGDTTNVSYLYNFLVRCVFPSTPLGVVEYFPVFLALLRHRKRRLFTLKNPHTSSHNFVN